MPVRAADLETRLYVQDRDFNRGFQDAERRADKFVRDINGKLREVGTGRFASAGTSGGFLPGLGHISEIIQGIPQIGRLAGGLLAPFKDAAEAGIRYNMTLENARIGLEGVAGSAEKAQEHIAALQAFGERTPFEFTGLLQASRYMTTFGFGLQEQIPLLTSWGNAVAASGDISEEALTGVIRAFGQMRALDRVNSEEMNQLAERGVPGWELLAKAIGKTVAETRKLGEQGRLNGPAAVRAITAMMDADQRFSGQMDRMSRTLTGRLSNLEDVRGRAGGLATQTLSKDISDALAGALSRGDLAESMAGSINTAIGPVSGLIRGAIVTTVGSGLTGGFVEAFDAAKSVLPAGAMSLVTDGILGPMMKAAGVQSPSTKTYYIGQMLAAGFSNGLADGLAARPFSDEIEKAIAEAARATGLDPNLIRAVIRQESGGRKGAVSNMGAKGLMQLMPGTARQMGVTDPFNVHQNVMGGSKYLAELLSEFKSLRLALAAYNAGPGAVRAFLPNRPDVNSYIGGSGRRWMVSEEAAQRAQGIPQNNQTPAYVRNIMGMFSGSGMRQPLPVTIVGHGANDSLGGFRDVPEGSGLEDARLPRPGSWRFDNSMLQPTRAVSDYMYVLRDARDVQFDLLRLMGDAGPVAEEGYEQATEAVRNWYGEVVDTGEKAKNVFGITGRDAAGAFEDAWQTAFTSTDLSFKGMASSLVLTFSQSINQMVQQWASAQISAGLGKFLSWGLGAIAGGVTGGLSGGSSASNAAFGMPGGGLTTGGPFLGPGAMRFASGGSFMVGGPGGTDKTPVSFLATRGEQVTVETPAQARTRGVTIINNNYKTINYSPRVTPSSYTSRRSSREGFESLLALAR